MNSIDPEDLCIANAVYEQLRLCRPRMLPSRPPGRGCILDKMHELLVLQHRMEKTRSSPQAPRLPQPQARGGEVLQDLTDAIRALARRKDPMPPAAPAVSRLLQDLATIRQEFGDFEWFPDTLVLAVPTPPVVLRGVDLGRFRIDLKIRSLGRRNGKRAFRIHTLDLRSAASNGLVRHPHVLADYLDAREHTELIRQARHAGRLADFFHLVLQALQTYDPHRAFVKLEDWGKVVCSQCSRELPEDLQVFCETCDEWCCQRCRMKCPECGKHVCQDCQSICPQCGKILCHSCITTCATCGASICGDCLQTGLCPACVKEWCQST